AAYAPISDREEACVAPRRLSLTVSWRPSRAEERRLATGKKRMSKKRVLKNSETVLELADIFTPLTMLKQLQLPVTKALCQGTLLSPRSSLQ
ncbi:Hypothetical predicted protein, partial [Pelobates cultripes]